MSGEIERILQHPGVWRGGVSTRLGEGLPSGHACLDETLPTGGWPMGALTEILVRHEGVGESRLLLPALARLSRAGRWLAWVSPPHIPYAPALAGADIDPARVLWVRARPEQAAWAMEQALRSGSCGAVLGWLDKTSMRELRRLQLAAERGRCWGVVFRPAHAAAESSPAFLRLCVEAQGEETDVHILRCRGMRPRRLRTRL